MSRAASCTLALAAALLLAGCSQNGIFRDRGFDYLRAEPGKLLEYPEGIRPLPAQELYPVPELAPRTAAAADAAPAGSEPAAGDKQEKGKKKKKKKIEIPEPPRLVEEPVAATGGEQPPAAELTGNEVVLTRDGNGYPVLMLDTGFDWAWQRVGDALAKESLVKVEDLDRGLAVYYVVVDGKRNSAGEPWQLKLNYTANGVQVALQVDEQAMAPAELAAPLMKKLREGLAP